jgi:hypothetical protein
VAGIRSAVAKNADPAAQAYQDALAAVIAFYFGTQGP